MNTNTTNWPAILMSQKSIYHIKQSKARHGKAKANTYFSPMLYAMNKIFRIFWVLGYMTYCLQF